MEVAMKEILNKYDDCDIFSLTGHIRGYMITEDEYINALNKIKEKQKLELKKIYDDHKKELEKYPSFDRLYFEIENECYKFNSEKNKEEYLEKTFNNKLYDEYKKMGMSDEKIEKIKENFFKCSFIADTVGKTTKYGDENSGFFNLFYSRIGMIIDRENMKNRISYNKGKNLIDQIPEELRKNFLYYEVSFYNSVTVSSGLMVNYYFNLNDETKKYLFKFTSDFDLTELEDLTIYKNDEIKFYSCTHERFNSL